MNAKQRKELLATLATRFQDNMHRHEGLAWHDVRKRLEGSSEKLRSISEMERTGGEPDVVGRVEETGAYLFYDCAGESPSGRRSVCYDRAALESRKQHAPKDSAIDMAAAMGIELLTEREYAELQKLGPFDLKTSSWIATPPDVRKRGGALFGDFRYGRTFVYHNGAQSYYAARGFRGSLEV